VSAPLNLDAQSREPIFQHHGRSVILEVLAPCDILYLWIHKQLIPYYFVFEKQLGFQYFNGIRARIREGSSFDAPALEINSTLIDICVTNVVNDAVGPFARVLFYDLRNHTTTGREVITFGEAGDGQVDWKCIE